MSKKWRRVAYFAAGVLVGAALCVIIVWYFFAIIPQADAQKIRCMLTCEEQLEAGVVQKGGNVSNATFQICQRKCFTAANIAK